MTIIKVRPAGQILFKHYSEGGAAYVTLVLPDPTACRVAEIEFRLEDFVTFADYAIDVAKELL